MYSLLCSSRCHQRNQNCRPIRSLGHPLSCAQTSFWPSLANTSSNSTHRRPPIFVVVVESPIQIQPTTRWTMAFISKRVSSTQYARVLAGWGATISQTGIEAAQKQSEDDGVLKSVVGASRHRQMFLPVSGKAAWKRKDCLRMCYNLPLPHI